MAKQDSAPKFPEKKVDDLIASFGREPSKQQFDKIQEMIRQERTKFKIISRMRDQRKNRSRDMDRGR